MASDVIEMPVELNNDEKTNIEEKQNGVQAHPPGRTGLVVQVTNVSPGATLQQLATFFGFLGTVTDIRLYPSDDSVAVQVKVCYIKYENNEQCGVAQHLTNTVFIDKALIVVPIDREEIPEESECQHLIKSINAYATLATTGYLPTGFPTEEGNGGIPGLSPPPVITSTTDPMEIEEVKRTIFVKGIDKLIQPEQLMAFFSGVGEVKYMRLCGKGGDRYAFIEFSAAESVSTALQYNGVIFGGSCLKVEHAKSPIIKPESERIASGRNTHRSSRDAVRRPSSVNLRRSRSRSRSRRRSRSRGRAPRSRSRSKSRSKSKRQRSRSRSRKKRTPTRSPPGRRSKSRSRSRSRRRRRSITRSRTRSPVKRRRRSITRSRSRSRSRRRSLSRTRSRDRRRRRRSPSKSPSRSPRRSKKKSKSKSPSRRRSRKSLSKSPDRSKKKKKSKDKEKERDKKEKEKDKDRSDSQKDLKSLLDKVYTYEEEKEKKKSKDREDKESSPIKKVKNDD